MEFEKGYSFCRSFQLPDPCEHLWCAHQETPLLCKTKKGPPMDGTACGREKVKNLNVVKKLFYFFSGVLMEDVRAPVRTLPGLTVLSIMVRLEDGAAGAGGDSAAELVGEE